jgi:hypothetical protein
MTDVEPSAAPATRRDATSGDNPAGTPALAPVRRGREPLYFVVIGLLCADVVFGLGLAVFAEKVIEFRPMAVMGLGLAVLGLGVLAYFVLVGDRPDKRRP